MAAYAVSISGATASTSNDTVTFLTTATGQGSNIAVYEVHLGGEASSSAVLRLAVDRSTGGTTPGGAYTLVKLSPSAPNPAFSTASTWVAQPTLSGSRPLTPTFNAFGGQYKWLAAPDRPIVVGTQGAVANLSVRSLSGTSVFSGTILTEEL